MRVMSRFSLIFTLFLGLTWAAQPTEATVPRSNSGFPISGQWTSNTLRGGKADSIALSPDFANDGIIFSGEYLTDYQGTSSGLGVARSQNGGWTWEVTAVSTEPYTSAIYDTAVSPQFPTDQIVFAATGGGLFRSSDGGTNWTRIFYEGPPGIVRETAVSPNYPVTPHIVAAGGYGGLSVSHDDGATWQTSSNQYVTEIAYADAQTLFIIHFTGIDRSVDGGLTWMPVYTANMRTIAPSPAFSSDQTIFAGGDDGTLYHSVDGGTSWITQTITTTVGHIATIALSPQFASDQTVFASTDDGLYQSTDGGTTWQHKPTDVDVSDFVLSPAWPSQPLMLVNRDDGVRRLDTNSGNSSIGDGFAPLSVSALAQSADGGLLLAGTSNHGIYRSADGGVNWQPTGLQGSVSYHSIPAVAVSPAYSVDHTLFAARNPIGIGASIYRSTDEGVTWQSVYNTDYVSNIAISPAFASNHTVVATATSGGLMHSTDGGDSWALLSNWGGGWARVVTFAADERILVGADSGFWQSNDGGTTWQQAVSGLVDGRSVGNIAVASDGTLLADGSWFDPAPDYTSHAVVFRSTDGGLNWTESNGGLPNEGVNDIVFDGADNAYLVTGTAVYHSTDGGQHWLAMGAPAEAESLSHLLLRDGQPLVGGRSGVWQHGGLWEQLLVNGSFENTDGWTLPITPIPADYSSAQAHGGTRSMRIGLTGTMSQTYGYSSARQLVTLPDEILDATLHFWAYPSAGAGEMAATRQGQTLKSVTGGDLQYVLLLDPADGQTVLAWLYAGLSDAQSWQEMSLPIPQSLAGREVMLHFGVKNDGINGRSGWYVDDASLYVLDGSLLPYRAYLPLVMGGVRGGEVGGETAVGDGRFY